MKAHEIRTELATVTKRPEHSIHHGDGCFEIFIQGDEPENVAPVANALRDHGLLFRRKPNGKAFRGATFIVPIKNVGTAFHAKWEYGA